MTTDAEKAREFYKGLFEWTFAIGGPESGHYAMANLGNDHVAGLGQIGPEMKMPPAWSVYFASDDLDDTITKVKAAGGNVMMGPMDVMEEGRMAVFTDPTGAVFGVWQPKRHTGAQRIDEPGAMTWYEVNTPDAAKARDFYCSVFDLEPHKMEGGPIEYYTLHKGAKTVGGVLQMTKEWAGVPPHWMAYFAVPNTDAAAKKLTALGGKVSVPAFDTPYGRIAVVNDPTGAVFSIVQLPAKS
ncbi:MAG: VOC family protein [Kofleriaceae bacterium]|nr:VOC family protein [Kofleriaceae bacterium]